MRGLLRESGEERMKVRVRMNEQDSVLKDSKGVRVCGIVNTIK